MSTILPELQERISRLEAEAAELRRIVSGLTAGAPPSDVLAGDAGMGVSLPPEVVVPRPEAVAAYLRAHPDIGPIAGDIAAALAQESRTERAEIELDRYEGPEIDDPYLSFSIRLSSYDDFLPRVEDVSAEFEDRIRASGGWVLITSDYEPLE